MKEVFAPGAAEAVEQAIREGVAPLIADRRDVETQLKGVGMPMHGVTLDTIGGGALSELFSAELSRILSNITDPNTDTSTKRVMTIQVKFKPNRDRDVADVELTCSSKLAGIMTVNTQLFMGRHQGKLIAVESDPRQTRLFDEARPAAVATFGAKDGD